MLKPFELESLSKLWNNRETYRNKPVTNMAENTVTKKSKELKTVYCLLRLCNSAFCNVKLVNMWFKITYCLIRYPITIIIYLVIYCRFRVSENSTISINILTHNVVLTCSGDINIIFKENYKTSMTVLYSVVNMAKFFRVNDIQHFNNYISFNLQDTT